MRSNLSVSAAASSRSLCKLADVKTELGLIDSSQDSKIRRLIVAASMAIAGPEGLRREPWLQTYQEKLSGPGGHYMLISRWPIQTVTSVTEGTGSSPTTVDSSTYSVAGNARRDRLYRVNGWTKGSETVPRSFTDEDGPDLIYTVSYTAGWVMPDQITEWSASTSVSANAWFKATDEDEPFVFQADSDGGTTDSTEPTWPTVSGGTVTDNDITWTAYDQRLPEDLEEAVVMQVLDWFRGALEIPGGIQERRQGDVSVRYDFAATRYGSMLMPAAKAAARIYR